MEKIVFRLRIFKVCYCSFPGVKKLAVYFGLLSILVFLGKGRPETDCSWEVNLLFNIQILNLMCLSVNLF